MMTKLRICMVTTFFPPYNFGGDGIWVYRLTNALARQGHKLTVLYNPEAFSLMGGTPALDAYPVETGVKLVPLSAPPSGIAGTLLDHQLGRPISNRSAIRAFFQQNEFDLIHFHNISLLGGPGILAEGEGIKICTLNDHWFVCAMHILWRFDREACAKRTCLACTIAGKRPPQLWRYTGVLEKAIKHVDAFVAPSESAVRTHQINGFPAPIRVHPYFILDDKIHAAEGNFEPPPSAAYFLFVGRLEKMKGVQDLIDVFRDFKEADLLIAGTGTYENVLREMAQDLPHVRFLGFQTPAQLSGLYAHAIASCVPSIGYETFGWTTIESLVHKTPVIAHDMGPLPEVLADGGGLLYRNPEELKAAIKKLWREPDLRRTLGEAGYSSVLKNYTETVHMDRYHDMVRALRAEAGKAAEGSPKWQ